MVSLMLPASQQMPNSHFNPIGLQHPDPRLDLQFTTGHPVVMPQMLQPRFLEEELQPQRRISTVPHQPPRQCAIALAHRFQLPRRLLEGLGLGGGDVVLDGDHHRSDFRVHVIAEHRHRPMQRWRQLLCLGFRQRHLAGQQGTQRQAACGQQQAEGDRCMAGQRAPQQAATGHGAEEDQNVYRQSPRPYPGGHRSLRSHLQVGQHRDPRRATEQHRGQQRIEVAHQRQGQQEQGIQQAGQ